MHEALVVMEASNQRMLITMVVWSGTEINRLTTCLVASDDTINVYPGQGHNSYNDP
jgi:hypothetical protein